MQIGFVTPGRIVKCGETSGRFLRMCGMDALVELEDGRRVTWAGSTEVELLSDREEIEVNVLPRLQTELTRLETFTVGKYAPLGIKTTTPCLELHKSLHQPFIRVVLGEQPTDAILCRRCNNSLCIRGEHLFWGTRSDCQRDMVLKGLARPRGKQITLEELAIRILKLRARISRLVKY